MQIKILPVGNTLKLVAAINTGSSRGIALQWLLHEEYDAQTTVKVRCNQTEYVAYVYSFLTAEAFADRLRMLLFAYEPPSDAAPPSA